MAACFLQARMHHIYNLPTALLHGRVVAISIRLPPSRADVGGRLFVRRELAIVHDKRDNEPLLTVIEDEAFTEIELSPSYFPVVNLRLFLHHVYIDSVTVKKREEVLASSTFAVNLVRLVSEDKVQGFLVGTIAGQVGISLCVSPRDEEGFRNRLVEFFHKNSPASVQHVETIRRKISEVEVFTRLRKKFNLVHYDKRLADFLNLYALGDETMLKTTLENWNMLEEELMKKLVLENGPEGQNIPRGLRLFAFCNHHNIDEANLRKQHAMEVESAPQDHFDEWMEKLVGIYGPEPRPQTYLFPPIAKAFPMAPCLSEVADTLPGPVGERWTREQSSRTSNVSSPERPPPQVHPNPDSDIEALTRPESNRSKSQPVDTNRPFRINQHYLEQLTQESQQQEHLAIPAARGVTVSVPTYSQHQDLTRDKEWALQRQHSVDPSADGGEALIRAIKETIQQNQERLMVGSKVGGKPLKGVPPTRGDVKQKQYLYRSNFDPRGGVNDEEEIPSSSATNTFNQNGETPAAAKYLNQKALDRITFEIREPDHHYYDEGGKPRRKKSVDSFNKRKELKPTVGTSADVDASPEKIDVAPFPRQAPPPSEIPRPAQVKKESGTTTALVLRQETEKSREQRDSTSATSHVTVPPQASLKKIESALPFPAQQAREEPVLITSPSLVSPSEAAWERLMTKMDSYKLPTVLIYYQPENEFYAMGVDVGLSKDDLEKVIQQRHARLYGSTTMSFLQQHDVSFFHAEKDLNWVTGLSEAQLNVFSVVVVQNRVHDLFFRKLVDEMATDETRKKQKGSSTLVDKYYVFVDGSKGFDHVFHGFSEVPVKFFAQPWLPLLQEHQKRKIPDMEARKTKGGVGKLPSSQADPFSVDKRTSRGVGDASAGSSSAVKSTSPTRQGRQARPQHSDGGTAGGKAHVSSGDQYNRSSIFSCAIILCDVVVGKTLDIAGDCPKEPIVGYDSVRCCVARSATEQYVAVYNPVQVLPRMILFANLDLSVVHCINHDQVKAVSKNYPPLCSECLAAEYELLRPRGGIFASSAPPTRSRTSDVTGTSLFPAFRDEQREAASEASYKISQPPKISQREHTREHSPPVEEDPTPAIRRKKASAARPAPPQRSLAKQGNSNTVDASTVEKDLFIKGPNENDKSREPMMVGAAITSGDSFHASRSQSEGENVKRFRKPEGGAILEPKEFSEVESPAAQPTTTLRKTSSAVARPLRDALKLGWTEFRRGNTKEARHAWRELASNHPNSAEGWEAQGIIAELLEKDYDAAVVAYRTAISIDPSSCGALFRCANLLETKQNKLAEAIELYTEAQQHGDTAAGQRADAIRRKMVVANVQRY